MSDNQTKGLEIRKLVDGGYLLSPTRQWHEQGFGPNFVFSCTTIDEALKYARSKLAAPSDDEAAA